MMMRQLKAGPRAREGAAAAGRSRPCSRGPAVRVRAQQQQQQQGEPQKPAAAGEEKRKELGVGLMAAWWGAELFGDAAAALSGKGAAPATAAPAADGPPRSMEAVVEAIQADYALDYFISGAAAMEAYADDCRFEDDFAAFEGPGATARFKKNVANLGGLLSDVKIDVNSDWAVVDNAVTTNWRFQGIVKGLPWRPLLAAAGSTTHVIDPARGVVVRHIERWKADPKEVVARLLRPARTPPGNAWETFALSLSEGDVKGIWLVLSPRTIPLSALVGVAALLSRLITGGGLPGTAGAVVEVAAAVLLPAALVTEVLKFSGGLQGGETGTGGRF